MKQDKQWEAWGDKNPYYGVLIEEKYDISNIDQNKVDFFETGERFISGIMAEMDRRTGTLSYGSALDFGCGVGRLTIPLAKRFRAVTGVDVSSGMLAEASKNIKVAGLQNVTLVKSMDLAEGPFDLISTYIVMQHIPPKAGYDIIYKMAQRLSSDGCLFLHVSLNSRRSIKEAVIYFVQQHMSWLWSLQNLLRGRGWGYPTMQMNVYNIFTIAKILEMNGVEIVSVQPEYQGCAETLQIFAKRR